MSKEKWNDAWNIMKNHHLEFNYRLNNKCFCIICKKVMINAHNGPCGCRYCLECINKYLNGEEKICPGKTVYCNHELLCINRNIHIDQPINREIMEIIVKCPQKHCQFKAELINIANHIKMCDSRLEERPFTNMDGNECGTVNADMQKNIMMIIESHTKFLFENINNLKNEIHIMKEEKFESDKNDANLKKINHDLQVKLESENREMKEHLTRLRNALVEEQKRVAELKIEVKLMNDREVLMNKDFLENKRETAIKIEEINKIVNDLKSISNEKYKSMWNEMRVWQMIQEHAHLGGGIIWCIDKWRDKTEQARAKINTRIDSEFFYSHRNGYKMRLSVYPNGYGSSEGTYLGVYCCAIQGECDNNLPWPFKHDVTFELINQHTTHIHTSSTLKYGQLYERDMDCYYGRDNRKPTINCSNLICSNLKFISLQELSKNRSLIDNDRILIRCRVTIIE